MPKQKRKQPRRRRDANKGIRRLMTERAQRELAPHVTPPARVHTCTVVDKWPDPDCRECGREAKNLLMFGEMRPDRE